MMMPRGLKSLSSTCRLAVISLCLRLIYPLWVCVLISFYEGTSHWIRAHPSGSDSTESACNAGDLVQSQGLEDPLEKGTATHSSILAQRIPWTEEPSGSPRDHRESDMTQQLTLQLSSELNFFLMFYYILLIWPCGIGIIIPQLGLEPTPLTLEAQSLNHQTTRKVPPVTSFYLHSLFKGSFSKYSHILT